MSTTRKGSGRKYGAYGSDVRCPRCGAKVSVHVMGRHKGSKACDTFVMVRAAVASLDASEWDERGTYESFKINGRNVRVLAFGIDEVLGAVTVAHTDGRIVQYIAGEWERTGRMWW